MNVQTRLDELKKLTFKTSNSEMLTADTYDSYRTVANVTSSNLDAHIANRKTRLAVLDHL